MPAPSVKVCPMCGHSVAAERNRCQHCMGDVYRVQVLSADESARVLEAERLAEAARKPPSRWTRGRIIGLSLLLTVLAVIGWQVNQRFFTSPPQVPLPSTQVSAEQTPDRWPTANGGLSNARRTTAAAALDGELAWLTDLRAPARITAVADEQRLYVGLDDNVLVALDIEDGRELWRYLAPVPLGSAPALAGDRLYVTLRRGDVLALDPATGQQLWATRIGGQLFTSPIVHNGVVYTFGAGRIGAIDAANGALLWTRETGEVWGFLDAAVDGNHIAVVGRRTVYIFDLTTGLRTFSYPHFRVVGLLFEDGQLLSVSANFANAVDSASRLPWWDGTRVVWTQLWLWGFASQPPRPDIEWVTREPTSDAHPNVAASLMYLSAADAERLVVANQNGLVRAYSRADGTLLWSLRLDAVTAAPLLTRNGLLLSTPDGLTLRDPVDGAEIASRQLASQSQRAVVVTSHGTYVVHDSGRVLALR